jgi:Ca2+-binding EF-hand superfamily protein
MVEKVFNTLDRENKGSITAKEIIQVFDVSLNPEFIERRKTKDQILTEFLSNFDGLKGKNFEGSITREEFFDYYTDISMNLPADEYFVRMMESTW